MNTKHLVPALLLLLAVNAPTLAGGDTTDATKTMAEIVMNLNHFPSDAEKNTLQQIANSSASTENERIIANSLIGMQHKASSEDKVQLKNIMSSPTATEAERTLAKIMMNINPRIQ